MSLTTFFILLVRDFIHGLIIMLKNLNFNTISFLFDSSKRSLNYNIKQNRNIKYIILILIYLALFILAYFLFIFATIFSFPLLFSTGTYVLKSINVSVLSPNKYHPRNSYLSLYFSLISTFL